MSTRTGWFADRTDDDRHSRYPWQPFLQIESMCLPLPMWFATEEDCEEFIREHIVGQSILDDAEAS